MGFQKLTETSVGPETSAQLVVLPLVAWSERCSSDPRRALAAATDARPAVPVSSVRSFITISAS